MRYIFGNCELNTDRIELRRDELYIPIEPQVFEILRFFVERPGVAISKQQLFDTVWRGRCVSDAALTTRIKSARKAIGDRGQDPALIKTLHGHGYLFAPAVTVTDGAISSLSRIRELSSHPRRQPSLTVKPFTVTGSSRDLSYAAEAFANELIRLMSRIRWIKMMSSDLHSPNLPQTIDNENYPPTIEHQHVVGGNISRIGTRTRITVYLIDAMNGEQIWCERYDRDAAHTFDDIDELARVIAGRLEQEIMNVETRGSIGRAEEGLSAWDFCLRGYEELFRFTSEGFTEAARLFARAIDIEPHYARAHAGHACVNVQEAFYGDRSRRATMLEMALESAHRAVTADERDALGYYARARAHILKRQIEDAETELRIALGLSPSFAPAHFAFGFIHASSGCPSEAIMAFDRFASLSPWDPFLWSCDNLRALSHLRLGDLQRAEAWARRSASHPKATHWPLATLVAVLGAERSRRAPVALNRLLERRPDYSIEMARDDLFFVDDPELEGHFLDGLRAAGTPNS